MKAEKINLEIRSINKFAQNLYRIVCAGETKLPTIAAGQFAHIKVPGKDLRRPICVYDSDEKNITFIVANVGEGTNAFTSQNRGDVFDAILPLGNGFPIFPDKKNVVLLGGGTGCAPLLKIAKNYPSLDCIALLGFQNAAAKQAYGDDFDKVCRKVRYCTDDGSLGHHGFPTDLLDDISPDVLYVCGAVGMMRTAREYCARRGIVGYASMEQRMGCGVGACLVCSVRIMQNGQEKLLRACADGPVFALDEIVF